MKLSWKVFAALTGIFLTGAVAGGFAALRLHPLFGKRPDIEQFEPHTMRKFAKQLELTPEQTKKIRPIIGRTSEELLRVRRSTLTLLQAMETEISVHLTPEQRVLLAEIQKVEREKREAQRKTNERPKPPQGAPERPPVRPASDKENKPVEKVRPPRPVPAEPAPAAGPGATPVTPAAAGAPSS